MNKNKDSLVAGCAIVIAFFITLLFVVLKLTGVIAWPWIAVLMPVIVVYGLGIGIWLFALLATVMLIAIVGGMECLTSGNDNDEED
jgi:hypothetical protein